MNPRMTEFLRAASPRNSQLVALGMVVLLSPAFSMLTLQVPTNDPASQPLPWIPFAALLALGAAGMYTNVVLMTIMNAVLHYIIAYRTPGYAVFCHHFFLVMTAATLGAMGGSLVHKKLETPNDRLGAVRMAAGAFSMMVMAHVAWLTAMDCCKRLA